MRLITKALEAIIAVERFGRQTLELRNNPKYEGDYRERYADLLALGDNPDYDDVMSICESKQPPLFCDECGQAADTGVQFGEDSYDNPAAEICASCIRKALELMG